MDENYDEFGNYIGPEMPEINAEDDEMDSSKNINNINQQASINMTNSKYSEIEEENSDDMSTKKLRKFKIIMI